MNSFERKGIEFLAKINELVENKELETADSLFEVLNHIRLRDGYHLGSRLPEKGGLGDESWFYTYPEKSEGKNDGERLGRNHRVFKDEMSRNPEMKDLIVEKSEMGAWQAYLLSVSPTLLPLWWHANYNRRTYIFDRDNYSGIPQMFGDPVMLKIEDIPQPSVSLNNDRAVVKCPYWNNWEGLVLESENIYFEGNDTICLGEITEVVLHEYKCGVRF